MQGSFLESDSSESHHEVNNYCNENYYPNSEQIDEFRDSAKRTEEFQHILLCLHGLENQDSFYYAIHYQSKNKKGECRSENQLKQDIENDDLYDTLLNSKENLRLDLEIQKF